MSLDIATTAFLAQMGANSEKPIQEMSPDEARSVLSTLAPLYGPGPEMAKTALVSATARDGAEIPIKLLTPKGTPRAVFVFFHGGGWVLGSIDEYEGLGRRLAERTNSIVALVGYRLAPEHPFPAAPNDAWDAVQWIDANMDQVAGERLPMIVGGDSAGGNLAARAAQKAAAAGAPDISLQVLVYPVTDAAMDTASYQAPENQLLLSAPLMDWFWNHYAPDPAARAHPDASPGRLDDLKGLAPALVLTAEHDVLRDEGEAYAAKMRAAGVAVTHKCFAKQMHNFFVMHNIVPGAEAGLDFVAHEIDRHFAAKASEIDVLVVGAGFGGLYSIYKMREKGLSVRAVEAGADVGGTWYWNRYPGARCDVESMAYSYSFSPELDQEWTWSERYAAQPEILSYANHVADKFDLRRDVTFNTRVTKAVWDEDAARWTVHTDQGEAISAQHLVMATGCLSVVKDIDIPGVDDFQGPSYVTGRWPHEGVDFSGLKVAVIGTGSSGIQSIPMIADQAKALTVYQRTPAFSTPAKNRPLTNQEIAARKEHYPDFRLAQKWSFFGFQGEKAPTQSALGVSEAERQATYERAWESGSLIAFGFSYGDIITNKTANETAADFIRGKVKDVVKDPGTAATLQATSYPVFSKRPCLDTGYYETFNRPHVRLVDLQKTPIEAITAQGIRTAAGEEAYDAIVYATGFDAVTGALTRIDIRGVGGQRLKDKWAAGPVSYLGIGVAGFPNFYTIAGPLSPSIMSNMIVSIEQHVDWIGDCVSWMRANAVAAIEPTRAAEEEWVEHTAQVAANTVAMEGNSWYLGANVPGKARVFMAYFGGVNTYRGICDQIAAQGYAGFQTTPAPAALAAE